MPDRLRQQLSGDPSLLLFRGTRRELRGQRGDELLQNEEMATTFTAIAQGGPSAFYRGEIADRIVDAATTRRLWPSDLTLGRFGRLQKRQTRARLRDVSELAHMRCAASLIRRPCGAAGA